ncbi:MAG: sulfotransferase family 2 domain-containing protein [Cyanobacteria bacterium P01_H01_bin.35]
MNILPSNSTLEIISVHVPKTAGATFKNILQQVYGSEQILWHYSWSTSDIITSEIKAIHGHFPASKYQRSPSSIKMITWVRNPVDRLISHYFYWQHLPISERAGALHRYVIEKKLGLVDFAKLHKMRNHISSNYIDIELNKFYFIGIQEFFEADMIELKNLLGFPNIKMPNQNRNTLPDYQAFKQSSEYDIIYKQLAKINKIDIELYEAALKKRQERVLRDS